MVFFLGLFTRYPQKYPTSLIAIRKLGRLPHGVFFMLPRCLPHVSPSLARAEISGTNSENWRESWQDTTSKYQQAEHNQFFYC